ncbi:MAG: hypothetical protein HY660_14160 [Armatimonadetes bacterium]|nr:hypothetical protein [Armatimonadota bacterium]
MSGDAEAILLDARNAYRLPAQHCFESHPLRLLVINYLHYLKALARDRSPLLTERGLGELKEGLGLTPAVRRYLAELAARGEIVPVDPVLRDPVEFEVPAYDGMTDFVWIPSALMENADLREALTAVPQRFWALGYALRGYRLRQEAGVFRPLNRITFDVRAVQRMVQRRRGATSDPREIEAALRWLERAGLVRAQVGEHPSLKVTRAQWTVEIVFPALEQWHPGLLAPAPGGDDLEALLAPCFRRDPEVAAAAVESASRGLLPAAFVRPFFRWARYYRKWLEEAGGLERVAAVRWDEERSFETAAKRLLRQWGVYRCRHTLDQKRSRRWLYLFCYDGHRTCRVSADLLRGARAFVDEGPLELAGEWRWFLGRPGLRAWLVTKFHTKARAVPAGAVARIECLWRPPGRPEIFTVPAQEVEVLPLADDSLDWVDITNLFRRAEGKDLWLRGTLTIPAGEDAAVTAHAMEFRVLAQILLEVPRVQR